jgi:hypothetical protein
MAFVPVDAGVYVNVAGVLEFEKVALEGVKVPPAPLSDGVIVPVYRPSGVIVKLVVAVLICPAVGPLSAYEVAGGLVVS